jgi:hypothetical protein
MKQKLRHTHMSPCKIAAIWKCPIKISKCPIKIEKKAF